MISEQIITFWFAILYRVCTMHIAQCTLHICYTELQSTVYPCFLSSHTHTLSLSELFACIFSTYIPQMEIFWQLCMHISFSVHLSLSLRRRSIPIPARWRSLRRDERFPSDLSGPGKLFIGGELSSW